MAVMEFHVECCLLPIRQLMIQFHGCSIHAFHPRLLTHLWGFQTCVCWH